MTEEQFNYWDKRVTGLMKICKQKNLTIPKYLDLLDKQELKKLRGTKLVVKDLSPGIYVNHKFKFVKEMSEEEFDEEVLLGFENNLLHNEY